MLDDLQAKLGHHHPSTMAFEQFDTELLFQMADLPAKCRLGDMQSIGSFAQAAQFRHVYQSLESDYVHR
ncbi:hypothetical protein D3C71_1854160 [compost metagenome]